MSVAAIQAYDQSASAKVAGEREAGANIEKLARSITVRNPEDFEAAASILVQIETKIRAMDALRKSWTGPLSDVVRSINATFKNACAGWEAGGEALRTELGRYKLAVDEQRVEAMRALTPAAAPAPVEGTPGVSIRTVRKFEVTDPDLVPRQFCSPDAAKIRQHLANGGLEAIQGVRFYDDTISTVRTK